MNSDPEFVVTVNRERVLINRQRVLRKVRTNGLVALCFGAVIVGVSLGFGGFSIAVVAGAALLVFGVLFLLQANQLNRAWRRTGVSPTAMRVGAHGLRCSLDAAPDSIFLPWDALARVWLFRQGNRENIVLALAPGVTPRTAGVEGLEHPEVQRMLRRTVNGIRGLRYATAILDQPVGDISRAIAQASGGRIPEFVVPG